MTRRIAQSYEARCKQRRELLDATVFGLLQSWRDVPGICAIYANGSFARRTINPKSDLDLVVVQETDLRRGLRDLEFRQRYHGRDPSRVFMKDDAEEAADYAVAVLDFARSIVQSSESTEAERS